MAKFPRIRPYKTFSVSTEGERSLVAAHEIVLERPVGADLEINLAPHPRFRGQVSVSTFRASGLLLEAASSSQAYLFIETWPVGDRRRKVSRHAHSRPTPGHVYLVNARGEKSVTAARAFAIQTSSRHELHVELCPSPPWARHVRLESSSGRLSVHLHASNVLCFTVDE